MVEEDIVTEEPEEDESGVIVVCGEGLLLLVLLLLAVIGGVLLDVTLMTCRSSEEPEEKVGEEDEEDVETTGVTVSPAGRGDGPWFGLRGGGDGDDAGLSKQITWGLTDPEDGGEKAAPPLLPPAVVNNPPVPLDEEERDFLKTSRFPGSTSPTHQESFDLVPSEPCGVVFPAVPVADAVETGTEDEPLLGRLAGGGESSSSSSLSVSVIISGSADFFLLFTSSTMGASS